VELVGEVDHQRDEAGQLVATLDRIELQVLRCLVQGMSDRQIAAMTTVDIDQVERAHASLMKKLDARTTADAVRSALYAGLGQLD
jgi:FixJ family two-component response regulator